MGSMLTPELFYFIDGEEKSFLCAKGRGFSVCRKHEEKKNVSFCVGRISVTSQNKKFKLCLRRRRFAFVSTTSVL